MCFGIRIRSGKLGGGHTGGGGGGVAAVSGEGGLSVPGKRVSPRVTRK